ncbi:60S ribosomal export protein NMD3 [Aphelenchoides avenae]|nr:60S ribosomal export protein NMD3 [Aphelenchus avenae]
METLVQSEPTQGLIACCECGTPIEPNPANMCVGCIRSKVDITEGIPKQSQLHSCRNCERYFVPPNAWVFAKLESKELLALCLKRMKPSMTKVRLVDAAFIWTEPHSKRVKVKMTIQREVFSGAVLQQAFVVEFVLLNQMCDDCRRAEAKDYWRACVQIRQKCDFKKTLFYLEQLLIKHNAQGHVTNVKPGPTGIDFFYAKQQDARKLVDFVTAVLPCQYRYSQQLITHDTKNNVYDYKHTFCVDVVPITKDCLVCLPKKLAQSLGNMNQLAICLRVTNVISLMDPATLQMCEVTSSAYWKDPFEILCQPKALVEFYVVDVELVEGLQRAAGHGHVSTKHQLADVWVQRANQVGQSDAQTYSCRTHLGHLLNPGDSVMGYDLANSNLNNPTFDAMKAEKVPDVILLKKSYDRERRARRRQWKLKRLIDQGDTASVQNEFIGFMEDLEEDELMREKINIYRDTTKPSATPSIADDDELPAGPALAEMLNDLDLNDVEMEDAASTS